MKVLKGFKAFKNKLEKDYANRIKIKIRLLQLNKNSGNLHRSSYEK